jgi:thiosulfate/3-mercaptopyruvate sulfurtransferase
LEPWEKVLVATDEFGETLHGQLPCTACHSGQAGETEKEVAHVGLVSRPSEDFNAYCGPCHAQITDDYRDSLHLNQTGYWDAIETRAGTENHPELDEMFGNHCSSCHTTCGDCHISQPTSVGGGFIDGHLFNATPSLTRNCTACHGSRVGNEYMGKNEGIMADVHFRQARMACVDCHSAMEMHNSDGVCEQCHNGLSQEVVEVTHRYDGPANPDCRDCHLEAVSGEDGNVMHSQHGGEFQCQICHSVTYSSCDSCHVSISEKTGNPKFETAGTYGTFVIGKNPLQSYHRPEKYVVLRHIPVDPESYSYYGENLLPEFDALPTWVYATPHNIQLNTPQTESCQACHGNADIFLTADKLSEEELEANLPVVVDEVPDPFGTP